LRIALRQYRLITWVIQVPWAQNLLILLLPIGLLSQKI
jgi:hypothetical protein